MINKNLFCGKIVAKSKCCVKRDRINKVKNIGDAPSTNCKLRIHIGLRGNSYYNIPKLAPGETFVVNKKA